MSVVFAYVVYFSYGGERRTYRDRNQAIIVAGDYWSMTDQEDPVRVYKIPAGSKGLGVLIWEDGRVVGTSSS